MQISATIKNTATAHEVQVSTGSTKQHLAVPSKEQGRGSSVNGGEFLMLALATCYCNDLFREAARLGIRACCAKKGNRVLANKYTSDGK